MREEGFYWVKQKDNPSWVVGFWDMENLAFWLAGDCIDVREYELEDIYDEIIIKAKRGNKYSKECSI